MNFTKSSLTLCKHTVAPTVIHDRDKSYEIGLYDKGRMANRSPQSKKDIESFQIRVGLQQDDGMTFSYSNPDL